MPSIVSVHSFRGGTGKSNITACLSTLVAKAGRRVGVIDTDVQSPGIHVIFGLDQGHIGRSLNDYLWSRCSIGEAAHEVEVGDGAALYLIPSALRTGEIARVLREGYDVGRLNDGIHDLVRELQLDYLFIDTHPGLNEETLLSIAISDRLLIILRPDHQDYQGTSVTVEVARRLDVPSTYLIVNKVPASLDCVAVSDQVAAAYGCEVVAVLPLCCEMVELASGGVFTTAFPGHPLSRSLARVADRLLEDEACP